MKAKLAELVLDFTLYPRHEVDSQNVSRLVAALEAGAELPPLVVDKATKRIVDGFHRYRAYQRLREPPETVEVELRSYADDKALLLDAVRRNAKHGVPFDSIDRAHVMLLAEGLNIAVEDLAEAMQFPADSLRAAIEGRVAKNLEGQPLLLKPAMRKFAGQRLNKQREALNDRLVGQNGVYYLRTALELLRAGAIDLEDEETMEVLRRLGKAIEEALGVAA